MRRQMRVWDLPLRIFHWALVIAVIGAVGSAKADVMWLHERFGLTVMGLVAFRIFWGFLGGYYARFSQFLTPPRTAFAGILQLLKPPSQPSVGHSAAAGYAVVGLLGVAAYQALTGSVSNDDVLFDGPLAHLVPGWSNIASDLHDAGEPLLFFMVALHIGAILIYKFVKKQNLTMTMLHGRALDDRALDDLLVASIKDGGISTMRTVFGVVLLAGCVLAANALTFLRPAFF
ncbi:MAG: cytochrome b/b6 domain-containing protein [Candidatus Puniceispirillaceae bacterium]